MEGSIKHFWTPLLVEHPVPDLVPSFAVITRSTRLGSPSTRFWSVDVRICSFSHTRLWCHAVHPKTCSLWFGSSRLCAGHLSFFTLIITTMITSTCYSSERSEILTSSALWTCQSRPGLGNRSLLLRMSPQTA